MSSVAITGNAAGAGVFTIASPNSASSFTLTLPAATGTLISTGGGNAISGTTGTFTGDLAFNSGYGSAATAYGCRAWVNFDGTTNTGGFCTVRASGNVTSVADNGAGDYTVNFTTVMPDANYAVSISAASSTISANLCTKLQSTTASASNVRVTTASGGGSLADSEIVTVLVIR